MSLVHRFLLCLFFLSLTVSVVAGVQPSESNIGSSAHSNASSGSSSYSFSTSGDNWDWNYGSEESVGSSFLGVDITDVSPERLGELKLKEEHGAEVMMVDQDAPAGKAGVREHDVIVSLNGTAVESAAQLRRMIKETPPGRVVSLGISRDGQPLTIKVQLADRHKSMSWEPHMPQMPEIPAMPAMPDFDVPVSVVIVHSSLRSGLMVENITQQLGEFFGVKGGKGVLVRSVEKGSRGEKAGFRAGDVVVKVNNQPVHDTSDFTHALRSSSSPTVAVTVMRDRREQNLTLTLPEKKDSGSMIQESFDFHELTAETEQAMTRAGDEIARLTPAIMEKLQQSSCWKDAEKKLQDAQHKLQDSQKKMQERQQKLRHEFSGEWAEI